MDDGLQRFGVGAIQLAGLDEVVAQLSTGSVLFTLGPCVEGVLIRACERGAASAGAGFAGDGVLHAVRQPSHVSLQGVKAITFSDARNA